MPPEPSPTPTVWTIKALLTWTIDFLTKKGFPSPRLDAEVLLAHVLKCKRINLIADSDEIPSDADGRRSANSSSAASITGPSPIWSGQRSSTC
jgi:hypothetical protein